MGRLTDSISLRPGRMPRVTCRRYSGICSVATSSVSRLPAFVTTPTQPRSFQPMMLFEPMVPTSESGASSITRAVPLRISGVNGSGVTSLYVLPTHLSNAAVSMAGAKPLFVGT